MSFGVVQKIKMNFKKANAKSNELTRIGRIKLDILAVKKEIEEKLLELGGKIYEEFKKEEDSELLRQLPIRHLFEQIKELEEELENYKHKLEQNRKENGTI